MPGDLPEPIEWAPVQWLPHGRPIPEGWRKVWPISTRIEDHHSHHAILIEKVSE